MDVLTEPLTDPQVRILGVLIEKQLATPQAYPLTENALLTGCNQSTARHPVVDYDSSVVRPALIRLRERALAKRVRRPGERAEKHAHRLDEQLGLSSVAPLALLAVLMLRGAQTPGELRSRVQRLHTTDDPEAFETALAELQDRGYAEPLPRRPGEKQVRWRHLLSGVDASFDPAPGQEAGPMAGAVSAPDAVSTPVIDPDQPRLPTLRELAAVVEQLRTRVATLEREVGVAPTDTREPPDGPQARQRPEQPHGPQARQRPDGPEQPDETDGSPVAAGPSA